MALDELVYLPTLPKEGDAMTADSLMAWHVNISLYAGIGVFLFVWVFLTLLNTSDEYTFSEALWLVSFTVMLVPAWIVMVPAMLLWGYVVDHLKYRKASK